MAFLEDHMAPTKDRSEKIKKLHDAFPELAPMVESIRGYIEQFRRTVDDARMKSRVAADEAKSLRERLEKERMVAKGTHGRITDLESRLARSEGYIDRVLDERRTDPRPAPGPGGYSPPPLSDGETTLRDSCDDRGAMTVTEAQFGTRYHPDWAR